MTTTRWLAVLAAVVVAVILVIRPTRDDTLGAKSPPPSLATQPATRPDGSISGV